MNHSTPSRAADALALLLCLLFFLGGLVFVPYVGLQADELLFAGAIYPPPGSQYAVSVRGHQIQTMLMSYLGTLKAWIYGLIFHFWSPSLWSVRVPVLLIGVLSVWIFFRLVRNAVGARAALAATALLATDASYILTTCLDWGPVALQHLLLLSGLFLLWRFHNSDNPLHLGAGFFIFGLALWDKALFSWCLIGLAVATLVVFPRALVSKITLRNLGVAVAAFLIGAAPLVNYNLNKQFETFRGNTHFSTAGFTQKALILRNGLDGSSLFGYIVRDDLAVPAVEPKNALERASVGLSRLAGGRGAGILPLACFLGLALLPWLWRTPARKPMLFALVFSAVAWLQMAFTKDAGASTHHTVLLWPFPQLFVGAALAQASLHLRRAGLVSLIVIVAIVCGFNLVVLNQHLAQSVQCGNTVIWTDASKPLSVYLAGVRAGHMYVLDWGILEVLRPLNRGRLPLEFVRDPLEGEPNQSNREVVARMIEGQDSVFIDHAGGSEIMPSIRGRLDAVAATAGYRRQVLRTVSDRMGRPVFDVFCFIPTQGMK
jgi:4-amino-4-deoxy-L-arabinose transferase-like glycosyltransferase